MVWFTFEIEAKTLWKLVRTNASVYFVSGHKASEKSYFDTSDYPKQIMNSTHLVGWFA